MTCDSYGVLLDNHSGFDFDALLLETLATAPGSVAPGSDTSPVVTGWLQVLIELGEIDLAALRFLQRVFALDTDRPPAWLLFLSMDPAATDLNGNTVLHRAVQLRSTGLFRTLLQFGADPDQRNRRGHTPVDIAERRVATSDNPGYVADLASFRRIVEQWRAQQ